MKSFYKLISIAFLILLTTSFHLRTVPSDYAVHMLHRELFFIPIILSSFWFGLRSGMFVAVIVSMVYTPLVLQHGHQQHEIFIAQLLVQVIMYLFVAGLIGWLSDRKRKQQREMLKGERETSLAKAASALSFEIQEIVQRLGEINLRASWLKESDDQRDFQLEVKRLGQLVSILSQYKPAEEQHPLSKDLNQILKKKYKKYKNIANKQGVSIEMDLDPAGCPTMVVSEYIERIMASLIENALDVSKRNQKIVLVTKRGGSDCTLTVSDEGPGVARDNLPKLFSPFFTTSPEGSGLSLSVGKKILRELGGDLVYNSSPHGGASFSMIVPRENIEDNVGEYAKDRGLA